MGDSTTWTHRIPLPLILPLIAVDVVRGSGTTATRQLVAVEAGLFSATLVQVSGAGIAAGQRVEVPAQ